MYLKIEDIKNHIDNSGVWMYKHSTGCNWIYTTTMSALVTQTHFSEKLNGRDELVVLNVFSETDDILEVLKAKDMREKYPEEFL